MRGSLLLGLDIGTSAVKAVLLPADADVRAEPPSATVELGLSVPRPGWTEQNPEDWWKAATNAIRAVCDANDIDTGNVSAIAASGQMHGAVLLDRAGAVLRPCILWNDQRTGRECAIIAERVGLDSLLAWVGNPALSGFTAPKLLWVREHEPEVYGRLSSVILPKDYVNFRLTGVRATDVSDASGTLLFDVAHREWSLKMVDALDISPSILPGVHMSTDVVGHVTAEAAQATGLRSGTPVVAGGADNACAAVSMGVIRPGTVLGSLGTSGTLMAAAAQASVDGLGRLHTFCHAVPDTWYMMGVVLSAGGSLRWYRDTLAESECLAAQAEGRDSYDVIMDGAASVPAGSEGLIFLPYLTGERTPHADPHARGAFVGLSLRHGRSHMARSVVEGVAYALGDSADLMRGLGINLQSIRVTGGGARSRLWRQILASVLNSQILTVTPDAGPAMGAAILAGVGTQVFGSFDEASRRLTVIEEEIVPQEDEMEAYRTYRSVYASLYPALKQQFARLGDLV